MIGHEVVRGVRPLERDPVDHEGGRTGEPERLPFGDVGGHPRAHRVALLVAQGPGHIRADAPGGLLHEPLACPT